VTITTSGDRDLDSPIPSFGGKGVFTAEIERALAEGSIDLAVHSLKDLPTDASPGLAIGAVTRREEPGDAWIARGGESFDTIAAGATVGTSSLRRASQLRAARPDLHLESIRGNVETRLRKLDLGLFDAIVLARAGLRRVGLESRMTEPLPISIMLPAPGQGALAVQRREGDPIVGELLEPLHDEETWVAVTAERAFLAELEAGCTAPVAAFAQAQERQLEMRGLTANEDGSDLVRVMGIGDVAEPAELGRRLARQARGIQNRARVET
jgi:hydroxymethylbilane synthase